MTRLLLQIVVALACAALGFTLGRGPSGPAPVAAPGTSNSAPAPSLPVLTGTQEGEEDAVELVRVDLPVEYERVDGEAPRPGLNPDQEDDEPFLVVTLRETSLEALPEDAYVGLAIDEGPVPLSAGEMGDGRKSLERLGETERFVLADDPGEGPWVIVAGRTYSSLSVSSSLERIAAGTRVSLELPDVEDANLIELIVRGPGGDPIPRFDAVAESGVPLSLFTRQLPGEQPRTWTPRRAIFVNRQETARIIILVPGAGAQCLLVDQKARVITADVAEPGEIVVATAGQAGLAVQVELRPGAPLSERGIYRAGLIDAAEARTGETVRFSGLQPGDYLITARPIENVDGLASYRPGVVGVPVKFGGKSVRVSLAIPELHDVIVRAKDVPSSGFAELKGTPAGVSVCERQWFTRGSVVKFPYVPAGTYELQLRDRDPITIEVPTTEPIVETSFDD